MKVILKAGKTSNIFQVFIADSSSTTGAGLTGLTNASSGLVAYYHRDTDTTATAISLVSMTVGTFTSSGFKEIDSTNMPGWYQFCPPNAALAAGAASCAFHLKGATNMAPLPIEVQLIAADLEDTVRLGLTALPNVASGSAGAIPTTGSGANQISVSSGQVLVQSGTGSGQLDVTSGVVKSDASKINGVSTSSVTTVNANVGTTQPTNFTGTGASALVKSDMVDIAGAAVSTSTAQIGVNVVQINGQTASAAAGVTFPASIASPTNITAGTITTVTNLTNAPTSGDFTATMKTSLNNATPSVTVSDKTGFSLSSAGIQAIWDALTSALSTVGSIGKLLVDNINATISSRFPTSSAPANFSALGISAGGKINEVILTDTVTTYTGNTPQTGDAFARLGAPAGASVSADIAAVPGATWDVTLSSHLTAGSTGFALNAAGAAGDPWSTALPGAYGAGSAGNIVGNNLNATVSSRLPTASYTAPDNTSITAIKAKTDNLPAAPAAVSDIPTANANADALLDRTNAIETGATPRQSWRLMLSALAGKLSGAATTTVTIRNTADTKDRITATVDANGNRTAVSYDVS